MVTPIDGDTNLLLLGDALVRIRKKDDRHAEIVAYPSDGVRVAFRRAKAPYRCRLHLADGRGVWVDLGCSEDWGDIQQCFPSECKRPHALGWGNDSDGHVEITVVRDEDGNIIPLEEFERDVHDFIIYHED